MSFFYLRLNKLNRASSNLETLKLLLPPLVRKVSKRKLPGSSRRLPKPWKGTIKRKWALIKPKCSKISKSH